MEAPEHKAELLPKNHQAGLWCNRQAHCLGRKRQPAWLPSAPTTGAEMFSLSHTHTPSSRVPASPTRTKAHSSSQSSEEGQRGPNLRSHPQPVGPTVALPLQAGWIPEQDLPFGAQGTELFQLSLPPPGRVPQRLRMVCPAHFQVLEQECGQGKHSQDWLFV